MIQAISIFFIALFSLTSSAQTTQTSNDVDRLAEAAILALQKNKPVSASSKDLKKMRFIIAIKADDFSTVPLTGVSNIFQALNSNGTNNFEKRRRNGSSMLHLPSLGDEPREIYPKSTYLDLTENYSQIFSKTYGYVLLEIDHISLRNRITFTSGDSLDMRVSNTLEDYLQHSKQYYKEGTSRWGTWDYYEGQVFGSLNLSHIKRIFIPEQDYAKRIDYWLNLSKKHSFDLTTYHPYQKDYHPQFQMTRLKTVAENYRTDKQYTPPTFEELKNALNQCNTPPARAVVITSIGEVANAESDAFLQTLLKQSPSETEIISLALKRNHEFRRSLRHLALSKNSPPGVALVATDALAKRGWLDLDVRKHYQFLMNQADFNALVRLHSIDVSFIEKTMPLAKASPFFADALDFIFREQQGLETPLQEQLEVEKLLLQNLSNEIHADLWSSLARLDPQRVFKKTYLDLLFVIDRKNGHFVDIFDQYAKLQEAHPVQLTETARASLLQRLRSPNASIRAKAFAILLLATPNETTDLLLARALANEWKQGRPQKPSISSWLESDVHAIRRKFEILLRANQLSPDLKIVQTTMNSLSYDRFSDAYALLLSEHIGLHPSLFGPEIVGLFSNSENKQLLPLLQDKVLELLTNHTIEEHSFEPWLEGIGKILVSSDQAQRNTILLKEKFYALIERILLTKPQSSTLQLRSLYYLGRYYPDKKIKFQERAKTAFQENIKNPKNSFQALNVFFYYLDESYPAEKMPTNKYHSLIDAWSRGNRYWNDTKYRRLTDAEKQTLKRILDLARKQKSTLNCSEVMETALLY